MQANDRLQLEISDQFQQREQLESQKNNLEVKYDEIMQTKMQMNSVDCQTDKRYWQKTNSTQTAVVVRYDEIVQVNLLKEEETRRELRRQERRDEQQQVEETLKEINDQTLEGLREKDEEIAALTKQLQMTEQ